MNRCAIAVVFISLSACASLDGSHERAAQVLASDAKILDVPFEPQQSPDLCGLVVVDMLTLYYQKELSATARDQLKNAALTEHGVSGDELLVSLREAGYQAVVYSANLDHEATGIYSEIDQGRPVIVMLENRRDNRRHFTIVAGYEPLEDYVVLMDPIFGRGIMRGKDFKERWLRTGRFTLLAVPFGRVAR